jgi:hypothetical protein
MRRPAAAETQMQLSSSTPCAVTNAKKGRPLPAPIDRPATAPNNTPFCSSTNTVPRPRNKPPPNASIVTVMLFVKI